MYMYQFVSITGATLMDKESAESSFKVSGISTSGRLRVELQNQPKFEGFMGPMYGGLREDGTVIIRYETKEAYDILST